MDDAERKELADRWKEICEKHRSDPKYVIRNYNIWIQGYTCTGNSCPDTYLGSYWAKSLKEACKMAVEGYFGDKDVAELYDEENNVFSGYTLYEADPPKTYEELVEENEELKERNWELNDFGRLNFPEFPGFVAYSRDPLRLVDHFASDELKQETVTGNLYLSEDGELVCDGVCGGKMFPLKKESTSSR